MEHLDDEIVCGGLLHISTTHNIIDVAGEIHSVIIYSVTSAPCPKKEPVS